jgi:hypothetical protein
MIAPLRETEYPTDPRSKLFVRARRAVAAALLCEPREPNLVPQVAGWKAWMFALWTVVVAASSIGMIWGWWRISAY